MKAKFRNKNSRKADDTTKIPSQLLEQLQTDQDSRFKFRFVKSNRKELRKASRKEKKVNKNHHHVDQQPKNTVKTTSKSNLKEKLIFQPSSKPISKAVEKVNLQIQKKKELEKQKRQLSKLQTSNPALFKVLTDNHLISTQDLQKSGLIPEVSLDEDTKTIEDYSKKLKLKNGKLNQSFKRDGLDFLLEDLGEAGSDNDDLLLSNDDVSSDNDNLETDSDHSDVDENMSETDQFSMEGDINMDSEEEDDDDVMEVDFDNADAFDDDSTSDLETSLKPVSIKPKIDIYGQSTGMTGAYVPPHLRKSSNNQNEKYIRLQRQIQGLLNRLSDANIESIVSGLQDCLLENPRHDVTEIITELVLSYIGDHANLLDSFSATYACLLAVLYHTIGLEFGAHFIQTLVERFEKERLSAIQESEASKRVSKQCTNYVTLLGFLYNFNVVGCILIYDLIKMAISQLSELDVEILLRLIRSTSKFY
ncbi:suppressor of glycerol defect [Globomyces sp. JEL0801]|nr:suppressor of glycerol defect [Globomyces sp. JEL0801]